MANDDRRPADHPLPANYISLISKFPEIAEANRAMARAIERAGPLDAKMRELIKLGMAAAAGNETATKSHVRRALGAGASEAEIEQAILLLVNTCGFSRAAMAWQWAHHQIARGGAEAPPDHE